MSIEDDELARWMNGVISMLLKDARSTARGEKLTDEFVPSPAGAPDTAVYEAAQLYMRAWWQHVRCGIAADLLEQLVADTEMTWHRAFLHTAIAFEMGRLDALIEVKRAALVRGSNAGRAAGKSRQRHREFALNKYRGLRDESMAAGKNLSDEALFLLVRDAIKAVTNDSPPTTKTIRSWVNADRSSTGNNVVPLNRTK